MRTLSGRARADRARAFGIVWLGEPWLLPLVGLVAVIDAAASIVRQVNFASGVDIAIFDQAVWHYSRFEAPYSSIKFENLLGDHFHPLVAVLAPLYWVWSDPRLLLIAQALLVAGSIVPVFLFARARHGRATALLLAAAYGFFWGLQVGVLFDFHEVAFAPLLIACAILFADRRQWARLWIAVALLLLVKEDMSLLVAFLGLYLIGARQVRQGLLMLAVGVAWYELSTHVFIPHFAYQHRFGYWSYGELGKNLPDALWHLIKAPWRIFTVGFSPSVKAHTMLLLFVPFAFFSLGSPVVLLALPLLAERFLSQNPAFWGTDFHYSMALAPIIAMSAIAGLANLRAVLARRPRAHERSQGLELAVAGVLLVTSVAVTSFATPQSTLAQVTQSGFYHQPGWAAPAIRAIDRLPAAASVATVDAVLSHVSERSKVVQLAPATRGAAQYLLANVIDEACCGATGNGTFQVLGRVLHDELPSMTPVFYDRGWVLARRAATVAAATNGALTPMSRPESRALAGASARWDRGLTATFLTNLHCDALQRIHSAGAGTCFVAAERPLVTAQHRLEAQLHSVETTLQGGCNDLAHQALVATHELVLDLARYETAAAQGLPLNSATAVVQADADGLDLTGRTHTFLALCQARPA